MANLPDINDPARLTRIKHQYFCKVCQKVVKWVHTPLEHRQIHLRKK